MEERALAWESEVWVLIRTADVILGTFLCIGCIGLIYGSQFPHLQNKKFLILPRIFPAVILMMRK